MALRSHVDAAKVEQMTTKQTFLLAIVALAVAAWASPVTAAGKVYRWVDENGVVHFGDAIPPEYSRQRHEVLNSSGTRVTVHEEKIEPETPVRDDRDRALLATYASVGEIEAVRDRRTSFLDSQNEVAEERLGGLQARRQELGENPAAINELATVEQRIREYNAEIERRDLEIARIRDQFDGDIARFRELKGLTAPDETAAGLAPASER